MLEDAILMATKAHLGQKAEEGGPYILHPLRVMLAATSEFDRTVAVLHDTIEDTPTTYQDIGEEVDWDVADAVWALTRPPDESYEDFIQRAKLNEAARRVKILDIHDNLNRPPVRNAVRQAKLRAKYLAALAELRVP